MTQRRSPSRPDPEATDKFRRSWPWIGGAVAALLVCILIVPNVLMAMNISEATSLAIGQLGALGVGIACIVGIRRVWRS